MHRDVIAVCNIIVFVILNHVRDDFKFKSILILSDFDLTISRIRYWFTILDQIIVVVNIWGEVRFNVSL